MTRCSSSPCCCCSQAMRRPPKCSARCSSHLARTRSTRTAAAAAGTHRLGDRRAAAVLFAGAKLLSHSACRLPGRFGDHSRRLPGVARLGCRQPRSPPIRRSGCLSGPTQPDGPRRVRLGVHLCLGAQLARMEGQAVLREIVDNVDRVDVARRVAFGPKDIGVVELAGIAVGCTPGEQRVHPLG